MTTQTTQPQEEREANQPVDSSVVGLSADASSDTPRPEGGKLPEKPQTLKTFTVDLDDVWSLP